MDKVRLVKFGNMHALLNEECVCLLGGVLFVALVGWLAPIRESNRRCTHHIITSMTLSRSWWPVRDVVNLTPWIN